MATGNRPKAHPSPFTPVFGKVPPHMAGRTRIIDDIVTALDEGHGDPNLSSIFVGARGTGKTALLTYLASEAEARSWIAADVTATPGMLDDIFQQASRAASHLVVQPGRVRLTGGAIGAIGSLSWEYADGAEPNWRSRMTGLLDALAEHGTGLLITVDEVNPRLDEMIQLVTVYQHFVREDRQVALLMAGLPHNVSTLLSGKSTSFLRRAVRHDLGSVADYEIEEAFRLTVESGGRSIGDAALAKAVEAIGGFPFMFQLVGYRAWNARGGGMTITESDVDRGIRLARAELEDRVFDATYAELSKGDVAFLQAMLLDDGVTDQRTMAQRLGKPPNHVSTYKRRLLEQGVIDEKSKGVLTFALLGFREYLVKRLAV